MTEEALIRVLLVEDDAAHAAMILRAFEDAAVRHYRIDLAGTFAEAEERIRNTETEYGLVITDVRLPDGSGLDVVKEVTRRGMPYPVLVMTSHVDDDFAATALSLGAMDYVVKSDALFSDMPHIVKRSMREWSLLESQRAAHEREQDLQRRLAHAERLESLGTLAGGVAHDLNNILSPLLALPDLIKLDLDAVLKGDADACERVKTDIDGLALAARRATGVVHDLMTLSGRSGFSRTPVSLNEVVEQVVAAGEQASKVESGARVTLRTELDPSVPAIDGAAEHLMRVVSNLMRNASDASFPGSEVWLRSRVLTVAPGHSGYEAIPPGEYVCLTVEDSGKGIEARDVARIFEPFYTRKIQSAVSGTGLGLSVVHGLVKDHDGYLDVVSQPGEGSVFYVYFPPSTGGADTRVQRRIPGGTEQVLVVDDDEGQCRTCRRVLENLGYEVDIAATGEDALTMCLSESGDYEVLIIDMILGQGWDGLETLGRVIKRRPSQKAIIVSGYAVDQHARDAMHLGVPWLAKPYEIQELATLLRSVLDEGRGSDE